MRPSPAIQKAGVVRARYGMRDVGCEICSDWVYPRKGRFELDSERPWRTDILAKCPYLESGYSVDRGINPLATFSQKSGLQNSSLPP